MRVACYAPMKAPDHPTPSGDRRMARALMALLEQAGHEVTLASRLRTWDGTGDVRRQERLRAIGRRAADRLLAAYRRQPDTAPELWLTYHVYHKAPDWLGPSVSAALGIPYVIVEASFAPKQAVGPWDLGHEAARQSIAGADAVVALNSGDIPCVLPLLADASRLVHLRPFLDVEARPGTEGRDEARSRLARELDLDADKPWLLAVGMMRAGDKLASYRLLAQALTRLGRLPWCLVVVGDGEARGDVQRAFGSLGRGRVAFTGRLSGHALPRYYAACDLFVWPAVNEAYGMAILEAQAAGLPVVAGHAGGVGDIVRHGETGVLVAVGDTAAFASAVEMLLTDPRQRERLGRQARTCTARDHGSANAARILDQVLTEARARHGS